MKLLFKQRFFSWLDSYDIYNENNETIFTVEGKLSFGHLLQILDSSGHHIGTVKEEVFTFLPKFKIYFNDEFIGEIKKEFTFFKPSFGIDCNGWKIDGDIFEWDYNITDASGRNVAHLSKEIFNFTDTYVLDIENPQNSLMVLMIALAIDAAKCSSNS